VAIKTQGVDLNQLIPKNSMHMSIDDLKALRMKKQLEHDVAQKKQEKENPKPELKEETVPKISENAIGDSLLKLQSLLKIIVESYDLNSKPMLKTAIEEARKIL